jgi:hypothetical protein
MITVFKCKNDPSIIYESRVVWSEGLKPCRIVLRKLEPGEYVTHKETLGFEGDSFVHDSFFDGNYFREFPNRDDEKSFKDAIADWQLRVAKL